MITRNTIQKVIAARRLSAILNPATDLFPAGPDLREGEWRSMKKFVPGMAVALALVTCLAATPASAAETPGEAGSQGWDNPLCQVFPQLCD